VNPATVPVSPGAHDQGLTESADQPRVLSWAEFNEGMRQVQRTGMCTCPVRLRGRIEAVDLATGELAPVYDTATDEPGGVLHVPCGNRRESVCPACSAVYKRDARQLVRAGLSGGKGIPESISGHPCVFATFTAPSFGPVHARRMRGKTVLPCRPRRDAKVRVCPHGRDISCAKRHAGDDPLLGRAMCCDCYDYHAAVLFNAYAGKLWKRFTTYLPRHLARLTGMTQAALRNTCRVRYVKVAEYQARGVVHYHAVIRLDAAGEDFQPPPAPFTTRLLCEAIGHAAAAVALPVTADPAEHPHCPPLLLRFGPQVDRKPISPGDDLPGTGRKLNARAVGNYIAKYATKALATSGLPARPIATRLDIDGLRCPPHHRRMIATAWELGGGELTPGLRPSRLCRWAHQFGHGGHFLTKSRRYSVTFGLLRRARAEYRSQQRHPNGHRDPWGRPLDERVVLIVPTWTYDGTGYVATPAAELALASAAWARAH
jgi:hypothetical protein